MQKKILVTLTATATAFSMLVAPCVTALAEDAAGESSSQIQESTTEAPPSIPESIDPAVSESTSTEPSSEEIPTIAPNNNSESTPSETKYENQTSPVRAYDSKTIDVGNVTTTDASTAVNAYGDGSVVNVHGNVDASGVKEYPQKDGTTQYSGATGVNASNNGTVNVDGNVSGGSTGVSVREGGSITVNGSVTSTGTDNTVYTWNEETQKYDIPKNTVSGTGISTDGDANIIVKGDVNGVNNGILINPNNDNQKGSIIVEGKISASAEHGDSIEITTFPASRGGIDYANADDALNDIPDLTVYQIDASPTHSSISVLMSINGSTAYKDTYEIKNKLLESIKFIVKQDLEAKTNYDLKVSGTTEYAGYDTVHLNQIFSAAANLPEGYEIYAGENVKVEPNGDGSFNLKLTNVKGGIYVTARLIPVKNDDGTTSYVVTTETINDNTSSENTQSESGAIVVTNTASSSDAAAASAAISGDKPARMVSFNMSKVTPKQYKESVISNVASAPAGGAMNIETDRVACFDKKMIQAIAARPDIDVNVVFMHGGKKLKVTIPAGYDVMSLLDDYGYCGFLRLMSILGSTEL